MKVTIEKMERLMESADVGYEVAKGALEAANGDLLDAIITLEKEGRLGPNAGRKKAAAYSTGGGLPLTVVGQTFGAGIGAGAGGAGAKAKTKASRKAQGAPNFTFGGGGGGAAPGGPQQGGGTQGGGSQCNGQQGGGYQYNWQQHGERYYYGGPRRYRDESTGFEDGARRFFAWVGRVLRGGVVNYFEVWRHGERILYFPVILFLFCLIYWVFWVALGILLIGLFCGCRYRFSGPHLGRKSVNDAMDRAADIADDIKSGEGQEEK
ncbi:MAG: hypothetical protein LBS91_05025 [Clostridiales Family XIII bacterium]|jgi:hypothetical protein|nr:hypothetical protein [Clostridiales Family XIII bacterium]